MDYEELKFRSLHEAIKEMLWSVLTKARDALNKARRCSRKVLVHALNEARMVKKDALNKARRCSRKVLVHALNEARMVKKDALNEAQAFKKPVNATDVVLVRAHILVVQAP